MFHVHESYWSTTLMGVDLMDNLAGRYKIRMKTSKWTSRVFYHLIDVAMVNAYILYHREMKKEKSCLQNGIGTISHKCS